MAPVPELQDAVGAVDPFTAVESLRAALDQAGIVLPSLAVDPATPTLALVDLGRVRSDVAVRLADALQRGGPPNTSSTTTEIPPDVLDLALPALGELTDSQTRGADCVWCAATLAIGAAHDLGPRLVDAHGTSARWFPRCCPTCWKDHQ